MSNKVLFTDLLAVDNMSDLSTMNGHEVVATDPQHLEPSCTLILILTGKVIMNVFIFGARHRKVSASFLGYCCFALAAVDFALLFAVSAIHFFQDFSIFGVRFTSYHTCLFTQIISHTYGILHLPIFFISGLDYYLTIVKPVKISWIFLHLLYVVVMLLMWITAFTYVLLQSPPKAPEVHSEKTAHICTFYISNQSFYLSATLVLAIVLVIAVCCTQIVSFIKSLKVLSYARNTVVLFSFPPGNQWPIRGRKRLLTALVFSFLGTWGPFVVLQMIIFALCAHIPAYMDMNVPWLYFINSFLIATAFGLKYPDLQMTDQTLSSDPFIGWKYCILPFMDTKQSKDSSLLPAEVTVI
ncbi:probable G-protein coupled receptor 160 [Hyperolius riggenbachi]|uniref:probable G-protein coupled receptor 160 n=1 Tax=Hyperolius riggenbachi TaxID=752182 RepID=UPI0035A262D6